MVGQGARGPCVTGKSYFDRGEEAPGGDGALRALREAEPLLRDGQRVTRRVGNFGRP